MAKNETIICKKLVLKPLPALECKNWVKRVNEYFASCVSEKRELIEKYSQWISSVKKRISELEEQNHTDESSDPQEQKKEKREIKKLEKKESEYLKRQEKLKKDVENLTNEQNCFNEIAHNGANSQQDKEIVQKIASNYTYWFIKAACKSEAQRKNATLSYVFSECIKRSIGEIEDIKDRTKAIDDILRVCTRVKTKENSRTSESLLDDIEIDNPLGGYGFGYSQALRSKIMDLVKGGLLNGKVALSTYKLDGPVTISNNNFFVIPDFDLIGDEKYYDFKKIIRKGEGHIYVNIGRRGTPTVAKTLIDLGTKTKNRDDLYSLMFNILKKEYSLGGSSIQIEDNKIVLNLTVKKPLAESKELCEDNVVGVDIGTNTPAVCWMKDRSCRPLYVGDKEDLLRVRTKFNKQRKRINDMTSLCRSGKEKKKYLEASQRITKAKRHWMKNYNHLISRKIIKYALENKAKYINMENISKFSKSKKKSLFLEDWSYFELQNFIEYKAKEYGIIVRYVSADNTSITCPECGNVASEQRDGKTFICSNPDCKKHGKQINADLNASINIALSEDFKKAKKSNDEVEN